jgi:hypothetical protein
LFGNQQVRTKVYMMVPRAAQPEIIDVLSTLDEPKTGQTARLNESSEADLMLANLYDGEGT